MTGIRTSNQRLVAAGGVAPAGRWYAAAALDCAPDSSRHHLSVIAAMPATSTEVKRSFNGATRRLTEGST